MIQLKYFPDGIHRCVTAVGKRIFDSNAPFTLPLAKENLYYCCINNIETKLRNGYK